MTTIQERLKWYSRRIEKPYESDNQIFINVYSTVLERGLSDEQYFDFSSAAHAATLVLDFYGKSQEELATLATQVQLINVFFPSRELLSPVLQLAVGKENIENANDVVGDVTGYLSRNLMSLDHIKKFTTDIKTLFPVYQQQLKFFNGAIFPRINFLDLSDKVSLFFDNLSDFVEFNGYDLFAYQKIGIKFDDAQAVQSVMLQKADSNNIINIPLVAGLKFFFETRKEGSNKYVNEIVSNAQQILFDRKMKLNWTQFLKNYLSDSDIEVNFFGKPSTETEASRADKKSKEGPWGPLAATEDEIRGMQESINNREVQIRGYEEASKEIQEINNSLQKRLEGIVKRFEDVTGGAREVQSIMNQYNMTTLIEAALECLLFKGGFNGALPDFLPGINPFEPQPPKINFRLPEIPTKLPVISINKQLQIQIRENLKRAAMSAVMSLVQAVAGIIKEFCTQEDNGESSSPAQDVIADFLGPLEDSDNPLYACYTDFGFIVTTANLPTLLGPGLTEASTLEAYLTDLAPLITPRELCDLFNNVASDDVLQIANNLIDSAWPQIRQNFVDGEAIQSFFACLGNLVDPSYCEGVYNSLTPALPNIDPCTIEDTQPYRDIVEVLENVGELYDTPDMACGAGIVPALADISSYNDSVTRLIDSIVSAIQQVFVNDLGNFKSTVIVPKSLNPTDQRKINEMESLLQFLTLPEEPSTPEGSGDFFDNLIPDAVKSKATAFQNIHNTLTSQAKQSLEENIKEVLANRGQLVAPNTRGLYESIEDNFAQSLLLSEDLEQQGAAAKYYSFPTQIILNSGLLMNEIGRDIIYYMRIGKIGGTDQIQISPTTPDRDRLEKLDFTAGTPGLVSALGLGQLILFAESFSEGIFKYFNSENSESEPPEALMESLSINKLYPYFYFGLINTLAYRVANSDLFDADKMNSLNLFPRVCEDGSISNVDLLDVNTIKQSAVQEFVDNSCTDREFELGPVRDAALMAIVELYLQVIIVDLVLKNIFITSKFGIDYLASSEEIIDELYSQITNFPGALSQLLGGINRLPVEVRRGASISVKKLIDRASQPGMSAFVYPVSGRLPDNQQAFVDDNQDNISSVSINDPTMQAISIRYLFEKRILGTRDKIEEFFGVKGSNLLETYLYNGAQFVDMKQMDTAGESVGSTSSATDYFIEFNYIDQGPELYDLYYNSSPEEWENFSGSVSQQKIEKESNSFTKYGTFAAEKYFEVSFSPRSLEASDVFNPAAKEYIKHFFSSLEPSTPEERSVQPAPGSAPPEKYLINFEKSAELFNSIVTLSTVSAAFQREGLPVFLTGYNTQKMMSRSEQLFIEVGDSAWDDSDANRMSDYTLIRDWWHAVSEEGLPVYDKYLSPQPSDLKISLYSPLNMDSESIPDWPTSQNQGDLEEIYRIFGSEGLLGLTYRTILKEDYVLEDDQPRQEKTFLYSADAFNGKKVFGFYDNDGWSLTRSLGASRIRDAEKDQTYVVAESKNFAIAVTPIATDDDGGAGFYIGLKRKVELDGEKIVQRGPRTLYSSVDFWDGNPETKNYQRALYFSIRDYFIQYPNEESIQGSGVDLSGLSPFEPAAILEGVGKTPLSEDLEKIFPYISIKTRMVYITPDDEDLSNIFRPADPAKIRSVKTFYQINEDVDSWHIATDYNAEVDISTEMVTNLEAAVISGGANRYLNKIFEETKPELISRLGSSLRSLMGPESPIDLAGILKYLYVTGEIKTYYDLFVNKDIFTDTKTALVLAMQAAFGSIIDSSCDQTALQNALYSGANRAMAPISGLGNSFLNKMLQETPKYILKGVVEMTEPHVIISKAVREQSKQAFQQIRAVQDMAEQATAAARAAATIPGGSLAGGLPGINCEGNGEASIDVDPVDLLAILPRDIPDLQEILARIQEEIDRGFPEGFPDALKPSATEKDGINLEGTIPYSLFVPPITPFGIIYLLMKLSELGEQEILTEDCEE